MNEDDTQVAVGEVWTPRNRAERRGKTTRCGARGCPREPVSAGGRCRVHGGLARNALPQDDDSIGKLLGEAMSRAADERLRADLQVLDERTAPETGRTSVVRFDTSLPFADQNAYATFDVQEAGFATTAFDGQYIYMPVTEPIAPLEDVPVLPPISYETGRFYGLELLKTALPRLSLFEDEVRASAPSPEKKKPWTWGNV